MERRAEKRRGELGRGEEMRGEGRRGEKKGEKRKEIRGSNIALIPVEEICSAWVLRRPPVS